MEEGDIISQPRFDKVHHAGGVEHGLRVRKDSAALLMPCSTINSNHLASDIRCSVTEEKHCRVGNVADGSHPTRRGSIQVGFDLSLRT